jgi:hypothetical protein
MEKEPKSPILTFEEFSAKHPEKPKMFPPRYNNFRLFFEGEPVHIRKPYFIQLCEEHPALVSKIYNQFQKLQEMMDFNDSRREAIKHIEPDMYEAYKFMRSYGAENEDLFA